MCDMQDGFVLPAESSLLLRFLRAPIIHDSYIMQSVTFAPLQALKKDDLRKEKNGFHATKDLLCDDDEDSSAQNGKTYQLYTLYRDKDGNIRQVTDVFLFCFF